MIFDVMTLFPDMMNTIFDESIIGRARRAGLVDIRCHNIRDYSKDKHHKVDDTPYGGGMGMLMAAQPIYDCFAEITKDADEKPFTVYLSPKGRKFDQNVAKEYLGKGRIVFLCGHYEGVDERVIEEIVDDEISIGDFVLTGGELPCAVIIDSVSRMIEGVLADSECYEIESIASGLLEYPQYTRPYEFHGKKVPGVLISGNHSEIEKWRFEKSLEITKERRPDMYEKIDLAEKKKELKKHIDKVCGKEVADDK